MGYRLFVFTLTVLFLTLAGTGARAQNNNTIELPLNVPSSVRSGEVVIFDAYADDKPMHIAIHLYPSDFDQQTRTTEVAGWLKINGMKNVVVSKDGLVIEADTDVAKVRAMFGIDIYEYLIDTVMYYSNSQPPMIPDVLNGIVERIDGLNNFPPEKQ